MFCRLAVLLTLFLSVVSFRAYADSIDHTLIDTFLKKHVSADGFVDFQGAKKDESMLDAYLAIPSTQSKEHLEQSSTREEMIAFWLNIYHAGLLKKILEYYPIESIQDIPGLWESRFIKVGAEYYSLNQIHNDILVGDYKNERLHFSLSCAAMSCPGFPNEAFDGLRVEGQVFVNARKFVNDEGYVQITSEKKRVEISRLFKWHMGDFSLKFGKTQQNKKLTSFEAAVISFIGYYLEDYTKVDFLRNGRYKIRYLPFDWTLRDISRQPGL